MIQKLIAEIGKSQRLEILNVLKRTQGLSVNELAGKMNMSYMGVKQHCVDLARDGYLDTWRRPKPVGRPEMLYRLTKRSHELFPATSNELTLHILKSATKLYSPASADKLLFMVFQERADGYMSKVKGASLPERSISLARLRDADGYMSQVESGKLLSIVKRHSPILDLLRAFPIVARLETEMFQSILKTRVTRQEMNASGLYCCTFSLGEAAAEELFAHIA